MTPDRSNAPGRSSTIGQGSGEAAPAFGAGLLPVLLLSPVELVVVVLTFLYQVLLALLISVMVLLTVLAVAGVLVGAIVLLARVLGAVRESVFSDTGLPENLLSR